jgi:hypothetical protein
MWLVNDGSICPKVMRHSLAPSNVPDSAKWVDLMMIVLLTGRERTEAELRGLFERAGLRLARTIPLPADQYVLEGVPA